jgi:hypothetical protein
VTVAARTRTDVVSRAWEARWPIWAEVLCFVALMFIYELVRGIVAPSGPGVDTAFANAADIVDIERSLGLLVEPDIHEWALANPVAEFLTTWYYTLAYVGGYVVMFVWTWFFRRPYFAAFRNWFWTSSMVALIGYWLYPLAPPRFTEFGQEDPTAEALRLGGALDWFQVFRNEYAAMPSMHCGLALLMAISLFWMLRPSPWRWLILTWPPIMIFTVMATANHWWLDAVGGAIAVTVGFLIVAPLTRHLPAPWRYQP